VETVRSLGGELEEAAEATLAALAARGRAIAA